MNVSLNTFTHCLAVISRCLSIISHRNISTASGVTLTLWAWPDVSGSGSEGVWTELGAGAALSTIWCNPSGSGTTRSLSTCDWLRGPAAAQTAPKRQRSSESLKINIYDGGYLSFYKRLGVVVVMQSIVATIIDLSQFWEFYTKVCQRCGSHFILFSHKGPCMLSKCFWF